MPRKSVAHEKSKNEGLDDSDIGEFDDEEPIPARRDIRIFHRDKDDKKEEKKEKKDDDFEEDVFV